MWKLITYQRKNVLGLFRACLPEKVPSIPCTAQNLKDCRRNMSDDPASQDVHAVTGVSAEYKMKFPKRGNFFIWNLTSNAGGSLMTLKPGSSTPEIECSGSYTEDNNNNNPSLAVIHDTTVFPLATWSITLTLDGTDQQYRVSVDDNYRIVAKRFTEEITDYDRFLSWSHGSYTMFESKRFRNFFMGCNTEGRVKLLLLHDKSHPDTRALFLMHRFVGLTAGDRPRYYSEFI